MNRKASLILGILIIVLGGYIVAYRSGWVKIGGNSFMPKKQQEKPVVKTLSELPTSLSQDLLPEPITPSLIQSTALSKGEEEIKVEYNSLNPLTSVIGLYRQVLAAKGWSVEVVSQDSRQAELRVTKEGRSANFYLVQTPTSGTQVSLVYTIPTN
jgi:hypothetical protein